MAGLGVTEQMLQEEQHLLEHAIATEQKALSKKEQAELSREACLERLKNLLRASNSYSQFLIQRLEEQGAVQNTRGASQPEGRRVLSDVCSNSRVPPSPTTPITKATSHERQGHADSSRKRGSSPRAAAQRKKAKLAADVDPQPPVPSQEVPRSSSSNVSQPALFTGGTMRPYQLEGFQWLKLLYENGVNGILADEMGLGKTIQTVALIAHLVERGLQGPFLVVAPLSTLPNWLDELNRFTPSIRVLLYHGNQQQRAKLRGEGIRRWMVVVTSYEVAMKDRLHLCKLQWLLLVVDEAHRLKNFECRLVRELSQYQTANRLLLTGTPLQNNLTELWSLLHFLIPEIFCDLQVFQSWFDLESLSKNNGAEFVAKEEANQLVATMQEILRPFLLRRTKDDLALELPTKTELLVYASLSPLQDKLYQICINGAVHAALEKQEHEKNNLVALPPRRAKKTIRYFEVEENDIFAPDAEEEEDSSSSLQETDTK